jgi:hypothetical protein
MRGRVFRPWRSLEELHEVELLLYNDESIRESFPRDRGIAHVGEQSFTSTSRDPFRDKFNLALA